MGNWVQFVSYGVLRFNRDEMVMDRCINLICLVSSPVSCIWFPTEMRLAASGLTSGGSLSLAQPLATLPSTRRLVSNLNCQALTSGLFYRLWPPHSNNNGVFRLIASPIFDAGSIRLVMSQVLAISFPYHSRLRANHYSLAENDKNNTEFQFVS